VSWPAASFSQHRILIFKVSLREPIDVPAPAGLAPSIRAALGESTRTGTFVDTRFFVYSRRATSGRVFHPLPLYANGSLLSEKSEYMQTLLSVEGFSESTTGDIQTDFPASSDPFTDMYDYASDSDLDDEEDDDAVLAADRRLLRRNTVPTQSVFALAYCPPSKLNESSPAEAALIVRPSARPLNASSSTDSTTFGSPSSGTIPLERSGRTIHVKDMAFRTWQSLIFYLYTGDVAVCPLDFDDWRRLT
jgi:hypothetical protein